MGKRFLIMLGGLVFVLMGVYGYLWYSSSTRTAAEPHQGPITTETPETVTVKTKEIEAVTPPASIYSRGLFEVGFDPSMRETSVDTKTAKNLDAILNSYLKNFTAAQKTYLQKHHFVLVPLDQSKISANWSFDEFLTTFDAFKGSNDMVNREPQNAKFVTPDLVLHAYHRFFENSLEELEKNDLSTELQTFINTLRGNILKARGSSTGELRTRYDNILAQITVATVLFENKQSGASVYPDEQAAFEEKDKNFDSLQNAKTILKKYRGDLTPDLASKTESELELIYAAKEPSTSPLFSQYDPKNSSSPADYTQYTPRSHYTKSSALRAYFRTMMYLGRSSYRLVNNIGWEDSNLLTSLIATPDANGVRPLSSWTKIMQVTGFYAGQSDDLTYEEWSDFLGRNLDKKISATDLVSPAVIDGLRSKVSLLRLPKILSEIVIDPAIDSKTKDDLLKNSLSFRIFGQRFTYDAWILNKLTKGQESGPALPSTPSALFIPAAFGNKTALTESNNYLRISDNFSDADLNSFNDEMRKVQSEITKVQTNEWYRSMQSGWDFIFGSFLGSYSSGYPSYMRNSAFPFKEIQTELGSYTELKHDTVLYAKQSYAELGGGGPEDKPVPPVVKGFVEPNILFWRRLGALVDYTQAIYTQYGLLKNSSAPNLLSDFKSSIDFFTTLAEKELRGTPITDEEYEKLRVTSMAYFARPLTGGDPDENSYKTALVTDVHTDAVKNQILYEATGKPYLMIALVGNENSPRAVIGLAFSHFEFTKPIGPRMTDEEWRSGVYAEKPILPQQNFWYKTLQP
jgi:hypothetical protein